MEREIEESSFVVLEEELVRCRACGKSFKSYKVETSGRVCDSAICKECRKKYS